MDPDLERRSDVIVSLLEGDDATRPGSNRAQWFYDFHAYRKNGFPKAIMPGGTWRNGVQQTTGPDVRLA